MPVFSFWLNHPFISATLGLRTPIFPPTVKIFIFILIRYPGVVSHCYSEPMVFIKRNALWDRARSVRRGTNRAEQGSCRVVISFVR